MFRKGIAVLMGTCLAAGVLGGCGSSADTGETTNVQADEQSTASKTSDEEPYHAVLVYVVASDSQDQDMVEEAFNKLTMEQLNMEVTLMPMTFSTWTSQLPLMLAGGEQVDLFPMFNSSATTYISSDYIVDLSGYLENYGPDLVSTVGEDAILCCSIGDFIYGVPTMKERCVPNGFVVRTDCLEAAGIDAENIKTYQDMTEVFKKVQDLYPNMTMFGGGSTATPAGQSVSMDGLGNSFGVLEDYGQVTEITNYYESEQFRELCQLTREWYKAGYVSEDMATCTDSGEVLMKAGNLFAYMTNCKPNTKQEKDDLTGYDTTIIQMDKDMLSTTSTSAVSYAVGSSSENPAKAVELLNWISKTKEANDLLNWGIEGIHWEVQEDGTIDYPQGVTAESCGYHQNFGYIMPNQFNSHVWKGNPPDIFEKYQEVEDNAIVSKAYGFSPDLSGVADQVAALTDVQSQYLAQLTTGSVEPEAVIEEFNEALYKAGLQDVMDAKQEQLDEWLKNKE